MCNCGKANVNANRGGNRGARAVSTPRAATRTPNIPTPTQQRAMVAEAARKQAGLAPRGVAGKDRMETERLRRLAVLRALGHN